MRIAISITLPVAFILPRGVADKRNILFPTLIGILCGTSASSAPLANVNTLISYLPLFSALFKRLTNAF